MRLVLPLILSTAMAGGVAAFSVPMANSRPTTARFSTLERDTTEEFIAEEINSTTEIETEVYTATEVKARLEATLDKLREKDATSPILTKEDIKVIFQDEHIIVVDKPAGVLSVGGQLDWPNMAQAVFNAYPCNLADADMMVVHRLGMDSSGLMVMAKNIQALRGMNTVFRTRSIERQYEALVAGHVEQDEGVVNLPLMRDYQYPPYMRVSTEEHQKVLAGLDPEIIGKKILEMPKESLTQYEVVAREQRDGHDVTRVTLTSVSGRTHQLNVHMAALGHPIVGDQVYGINGDAVEHGGLTEEERNTLLPPNPARVSQNVPYDGTGTCVHAKSLKFRHPITRENMELSSESPF